MIIRRFLFFLLVSVLLPSTWAQTFISEERMKEFATLLPAPPEATTPAGMADLNTLLSVQSERTPDQVRRARRVADQTVVTFAIPVLGDWFDVQHFPKTMAIFEKIEHVRSEIVDEEVKAQWDRPRPYAVSKEIQPVVDRPGNSSYPSGHSSAAAVWGTILAAAFPDKAAEFQKQINEAAWCRILGGVHYPSDVAAGKFLGTQIANAMLESPEMQKALETIRAELAPYMERDKEEVSRTTSMDTSSKISVPKY